MVKDLRSNLRESRQVLVDLLFTDLDLPQTFLDTARASSSPETQKRNVLNALKAYHEVSAKAEQVAMTEIARTELEARIKTLRNRLAKFGPGA